MNIENTTVPKFNRKIAERGNIDALSAQIHDRSLFKLGAGTSRKRTATI